jgi:hypothetical protein
MFAFRQNVRLWPQCFVVRRDQGDMPYSECLRQLEYRHDRRISPPLLKVAYILLRKARTFRELLLREPALNPDALHVPSDQPPHVHRDRLAGYAL